MEDFFHQQYDNSMAFQKNTSFFLNLNLGFSFRTVEIWRLMESSLQQNCFMSSLITEKGDNSIDASVCIPLHICSITIIYIHPSQKKTMISYKHSFTFWLLLIFRYVYIWLSFLPGANCDGVIWWPLGGPDWRGMDALFFACCLGNLENIKGWCLDTQMKRREREREIHLKGDGVLMVVSACGIKNLRVGLEGGKVLTELVGLKRGGGFRGHFFSLFQWIIIFFGGGGGAFYWSGTHFVWGGGQSKFLAAKCW